MLIYVVTITVNTLFVAFIIACFSLYFGLRGRNLAAHAEHIASAPFNYKTALFILVVLYILMASAIMLMYALGFGSALLCLIVVGINMHLGDLMHRGLCLLIWKHRIATVTVPV